MILVMINNLESDPKLHGAYEVIHVIDGDTILIDLEGTNTKVRLIGIDAPESAHEDESKNAEAGKQATIYLNSLLYGNDVYLEYDKEKYDQYGRLLAYVYLPDQKTMVNELVLMQGHALTLTIRPNMKYANLFEQLMKEAQEKQLGIWKEAGP